MSKIRSWRDSPKPGETDSGWNAQLIKNVGYGHINVVKHVSGYQTEQDAIDALTETRN